MPGHACSRRSASQRWPDRRRTWSRRISVGRAGDRPAGVAQRGADRLGADIEPEQPPAVGQSGAEIGGRGRRSSRRLERRQPPLGVGADVRPEQGVVVDVVIVARAAHRAPCRAARRCRRSAGSRARRSAPPTAPRLELRLAEIRVGDQRAEIGSRPAPRRRASPVSGLTQSIGDPPRETPSGPALASIDVGDLRRIGRLGEALPGEQAARLIGPLAGGKGQRGQVGRLRDRPADHIGGDDPARLGRAARPAPAAAASDAGCPGCGRRG